MTPNRIRVTTVVVGLGLGACSSDLPEVRPLTREIREVLVLGSDDGGSLDARFND